MNRFQDLVYDFHEATNGTIGQTPALRDNELRAKLIMEEAVETVAALGYNVHALIEAPVAGKDWGHYVAEFRKRFDEPDIIEVIDGMCDLIYVTLGTAVAMGVDLDQYFNEVHRSNMDKLQGPKREDGKQLKPEGWQPPNLRSILEREADIAAAWARIGIPDGEVVSGL